MTGLAHKLKTSPAEYLAGENIAKARHQYVDGEVFAMAGGTKAHNLIALNLARLLHSHLRGTPCQVFSSDVKVHVAWEWRERYYYPDVAVGCEVDDDDPYIIARPRLIVEVLSGSTERDDRSDKFYAYRRLASLEEYVLVAQDTLRVEVYRRETGWDLELYIEETDQVALQSVGLVTTVADLYEGLPELFLSRQEMQKQP